MITIAGGIVLAVIFLAFLPIIIPLCLIGGALLIAGTVLFFLVQAAPGALCAVILFVIFAVLARRLWRFVRRAKPIVVGGRQ